MDKNQFIEEVQKKFLNLNENQIKKFDDYKKFLQEQNKLFNLTRLDSDELIYEKYFLQAIIPFIGIDLNNINLLDIGSGSGNPGLILKIIFPKMKLTIIESNKKRVEFMKKMADILNLDQVTFYSCRAEEASKSLYNKFDIVTSRAVSNLGSLIEISCQLSKIGGLIIEPKSNEYQNELDLIKEKLNDYGVKIENIINYDEKNTILYFKKISKPLDIYPRQWKEIIKEYKK